MEVFKEFRFESSHQLPDAPPGHMCRRLHGHSYRVRVFVAGPVEPRTGWVVDFGDLKRAFEPLREQLDHAHLNDLPGLAQPTTENLARWLWERLKGPLPGLSRLEIWETASSGCVYDGTDALK